MTTVLVVVAHPDDAEIGMGMRMRWYADSGADVRVHCLSPGSADPGQARVRVAECERAGALLGVAGYTFSDVPDTRFADHRGRINAALFDVMTEVRPDAVYTHHPADQHLDHAVLATEVTAVALRQARDLCYFRSPYSVEFEPHLFFLGTGDLLKAKMEALHCFASQGQFDMRLFGDLAALCHRQHIHHRVLERLPAGPWYAESFRIRRLVRLA